MTSADLFFFSQLPLSMVGTTVLCHCRKFPGKMVLWVPSMATGSTRPRSWFLPSLPCFISLLPLPEFQGVTPQINPLFSNKGLLHPRQDTKKRFNEVGGDG